MKKVLFLAVLMVMFLCSTASALTLWQIDATSTNDNWGDFSVIFNDSNDDNVIDIGPMNLNPPDSISSFSGVQYDDSTFGLIELDRLAYNPGLTIAPIELLPGIPFPSFVFNWSFTGTILDPSGNIFDPNYTVGTGSSVWTYTASQAQAPVPEPATLLLLGTGLVGLAGARRKFKK
jgi:hypothetical protein